MTTEKINAEANTYMKELVHESNVIRTYIFTYLGSLHQRYIYDRLHEQVNNMHAQWTAEINEHID